MTSWFISHHSSTEPHWPGGSLFLILLSDSLAVNDSKYLLGGWKGEGSRGLGRGRTVPSSWMTMPRPVEGGFQGLVYRKEKIDGKLAYVGNQVSTTYRSNKNVKQLPSWCC